MQLFLEPRRHAIAKAAKAARGMRQVRFEDAFEFNERLLIECDIVELVWSHPRFAQAVVDGPAGKTGVVLEAAEALLLSRSDDFAVHDERRCAVMVKGRDAEDGGHLLRTAGASPWAQPCSERSRSLPR